ncbi:rod shape-determining protein MreC [Solidesulfovibrio magneticus]|uniref:Cell shape-determining protein MreC n=1 Tax=Solidesulfovibrio magneticus (strain ATCC 700980 / DSM 13731 / RS-1) TaxID=573370 RepID=C4XI00_SOLM1|nr:rod shape-determining protein MreC [Solidesulfovibrio magneticus]BAH73962.1 rod shape-determining protein MreC [Solidesulfovibrio magneticus RS-1]
MAPGKWVHEQVASFWSRYLYFVGIRQQNDQLRLELDSAKKELAELRESASEVERLRQILSLTPPIDWTRRAARIISHRLGPNAALETFLIDKGSAHGVSVNMPVVSPDGVVGRVLRLSPTAATILLITDPNSRIPVVSQKNRTQGIVKGEGPTKELTLQYVPQGAPVEEGEVLVTSGLEEIFPKGLPVAKVTSVGRSGSSLFQLIHAAPLFTPRQLEEVALLFRATAAAAPVPTTAPVVAPPPPPATAPVSPVITPPNAAPSVKPPKGLKTPAAIPPAPGQGAPPPPPPAPAPTPAPAPAVVEPAKPAKKADKPAESEKKRRKPARTEGQ